MTTDPERPTPSERLHRDELVFAHQGLVRAIARGIHRSFPSHIELDDLIAYGQLGLAQAARDFDPERGIQFSTFAYYRIRGAILDGANQMNWLRRTTRAGDAYERMSGDLLGMEAADAASGGGGSDVNWLGDTGGRLAVVFLLGQAGDDEARLDPEDDSTPLPLESLLDDELKATLRVVLAELPDDARQLLQATYFEGKTLKEAGERLGISKAWASRLHARALDQLARALRRAHVAE
jgi:RNA polymerase sigma factor for flagellar operon FliA